MVFEISKAQKEQLGQRIAWCVKYLEDEIQPHLISKDKIRVCLGESLELFLTDKEMYVKEIKFYNLIVFEFHRSRILYLDKKDRKRAKKYICDVSPESAVEFLKHWEPAKDELNKQVDEKNNKVSEFDKFVDNFKL